LIAVDNLGIPATMLNEVARRLKARANLPAERLAITATHTHTAPMLKNVAPTLFSMPIPPEHQERIDRYTKELTDHLEKVALAALADRKPARLAYGMGKATFAMNRRTKGGPVDHDLPLLAVYGADDKLRAVHVNYACHCVTLSNNKISGDWAGFVQSLIEENHPGAIALVSIGCGADQNPTSGVTGDKVDIARAQGAEIAAEVRRLLGGLLTPLEGALTTRTKKLTLPLADLPTKEQWEAKATQKGAVGYHAQVNLARLQRGGKIADRIDYPVQVWTFGKSLAMVFLPGEVVVDYSLRLKKELDGQRLWIHAYANDAPCYIPSERVLKEGGYEGGGAMVYYDLPVPLRAGLEQTIVDAVKELAGPSFKSPIDFKKCETPPLSPQQSLAAIHVRKGLKVGLAVAEPLIMSPVAIDFGPDGSLWVAEMADYPLGAKGNYEPGGRIKRLVGLPLLAGSPSQGGTPTATIFLDNIPFPTGVTAYKKGVLVCAAPDILYAEDTDGDGKADIVKKLFTGFGTGNYQGRVNSLESSLDGWIYGACGLFGGTITSHTGKVVQLGDRDFRIKPEEGIIEPASGRTQQGRVRDDWDNWFGCDNSTLCRHYPLADHYLRRNPHVPQTEVAVYVPDYPNSNRLFPIGKQQLFKLSGPPGGVTAACGLGIYRDDLLGKEFTGNAFVCEPVNNAVHRLILSPKQSTFAGRRAQDEQTSEFLASTDMWFRPVQVRIGPDGALWVVDMYRYVIEHPRWIPPEDNARLDLRAGSTMGRIYRVVPADAPVRVKSANLASLTVTELAAALDSANSWQRDQASQLLLSRQREVKHALVHKLMKHSRPETRLHALCLQGELGRLCAADIESALLDPHPGVRRHALRLAEDMLQDTPEVAAALEKQVVDADPQVRLQLACTLGQWRDPQSGSLLARLALDPKADNYLRAAVMSSVHDANLASFASAVLADKTPPSAILQRLAFQVAAQGDTAIVSRFLETIIPEGKDSFSPARLGAIAAFLDRVQMRGPSLDQLATPPVRKRLHQVLAEAREVVQDAQRAEETRAASIALLCRTPERLKGDLETLGALLTPQTPASLQSAALQAMGRQSEDRAVQPIFDSWRGLTPSLKNQALDTLLSRNAWQVQLLDAIRAKKIGAGDVDAARRQRLVTSKDARIAKLATEVLAGSATTDRKHVIDQYRNALQRIGDVNKGHEVYRKHCAACHRLGGQGFQVGPDLAVALGKSREYLLIEILDPSRNLDSRYVEYLATTSAGRTLTGLLAAETSTSITLRGQEDKQQVLLRSELDSLTSSGRSLMPEGLEKEVSPAAMADLLAFLANAAPPRTPKKFPGNHPAIVRPRDKGLALLATNAEIYGGDISFEGKPFDNIGFWHGADDHAGWRVELDRAARFDVWLDYSCHADSAGNRFVIEGAAKSLAGQVTSTGGWDRYRMQKVGTIELTAGSHRITLRPDGGVRGALMDLRGLYFVAEGSKPPASPQVAGEAPAPKTVPDVARLILDDKTPSAKRQALIDEHLERADELIVEMTRDLPAGSMEEYRRIPWIWRVAIAAGKRNEADQLRKLLERSVPQATAPLLDWQAVVVGGGVINGVSLISQSPRRRIDELLKGHDDLRRRWQRSLALAATMADDIKVPMGTRYDALRMIALDDWNKCRPQLAKYLAKDAHPELQMGAVSGLADTERKEAATMLQESLEHLTPGNRKLAEEAIKRLQTK
jgi:putative membrane-bound dehydrogenase-like protein